MTNSYEQEKDCFPEDEPLKFVSRMLKTSGFEVAWSNPNTSGLFRAGILKALKHATKHEDYEIHKLLLANPVTKDWISKQLEQEFDF